MHARDHDALADEDAGLSPNARCILPAWISPSSGPYHISSGQ